MRTETAKTYLRARVQNASSAGLVIILFDLLISDLEQAIAALAEGNVEKRATALKHAFLVLQQLDDSLDRERGGQAAQTFSAFYSAIRAKLLEAHIQASPEVLRHQIKLLFEVRQAWQEVDKPSLSPTPAPAADNIVSQPSSIGHEELASAGSWSA